MLRIAFKLKEFNDDEVLLKASCIDYMYIYPAQARDYLIGGFGISINPNVHKYLSNINKNIFKFYHYPSCVFFLFLGETFYFDELLKIFGLAPFVVRDGEIVYYIDATEEELEFLKEHYSIYIERNAYCEYYDQNLNGLNPLLQLISLLPFDEIKKEYLITSIKLGFASKWINLTKLPINRSNKIVSELRKIKNVTSTRHAQKLLSRYIDEFIRKYLEIFRDMYSVSFSADSNSALKVFYNVYNALRNPETKKRVMANEYQPELTIKSVEIHFKLTLPNEELAYKILEALREEFTNAKLLYKPNKEAKDLLYRFSVKVDVGISYHNVQEFTRLIHYITGGIIESVTKNTPTGHMSQMLVWLVRISRMLMWIKKIWFRITAPPHFREAILESLNETKWLIISLEEKSFYDDTWVLEGEAWCDYQIFKPKRHITPLLLSKKEDISESDLYYFAVDRNFLKDCMRFFTAFSENLRRRYPDVLLI